jgi:endonuclease YncB( thermonuclease family)
VQPRRPLEKALKAYLDSHPKGSEGLPAPEGRLEIVPKREKYGRTLARLWIGGKDAAAIMMADGLAQPFWGGKKPDWCGAIVWKGGQ